MKWLRKKYREVFPKRIDNEKILAEGRRVEFCDLHEEDVDLWFIRDMEEDDDKEDKDAKA